MIAQLKNPMTDQQLSDLKQVLEHAGQGDYVPLLIIAGVLLACFIIIASILIAWYKKDAKENKEVKDLSVQNAKIIGAHEVEIRNLREKIGA